MLSQKSTPGNKNLMLLLVYLILCFYCSGVVMMINFFNYPSFDRIHENLKPVLEIYNMRMIFIYYIPSVLLFLFSVWLLMHTFNTIPRCKCWASVFLSATIITTLFFILIPVQSTLISTGFKDTLNNKLIPLSLYFQVIPTLLQALLAFWIMNIYFKEVKLLRRWLFMLSFALVFYLVGSDYVEKFINYPVWAVIGQKDWLSFRTAVPAVQLLLIYVIPAFVPILLLLLMIWWRPQGVNRALIFLALLPELWAFVVTGNYFVPQIQGPLSKAYSLSLIEELMRNDFPLRGIPLLMLLVITAVMFIKIAKHNQNFI